MPVGGDLLVAAGRTGCPGREEGRGAAERDNRPWAPSVLAALLVLAAVRWCFAGKARQLREASARGETAAAAELDRRAAGFDLVRLPSCPTPPTP
ncbi:hypothetical protein [Micromonospora palythoicola]|uniref:hypothetical protein n=1 Tax=Micromonospora palythoicola TaxID=3120507 RepID=UPI002FCDE8E3